jgi:hypothetical protein
MGLQPVELRGDAGVQLIIIGVVFFTLASAAVALRLISRRVAKKSLAAEDWMVCVALVKPSFFFARPRCDVC